MMYGNGWENLTLLAPVLKLSDVEVPFEGNEEPPSIRDDVVLVLVDECNAQPSAVERAHPDASIAEIHGQNGQLLYTLFFLELLTCWSTSTSLGLTTFTDIADSACTSQDAVD